MSRSSSDLPTEPFQMKHLACGNTSEVYPIEWPPKVVICNTCGTALRLVTHDRANKSLTYRRL